MFQLKHYFNKTQVLELSSSPYKDPMCSYKYLVAK